MKEASSHIRFVRQREKLQKWHTRRIESDRSIFYITLQKKTRIGVSLVFAATQSVIQITKIFWNTETEVIKFYPKVFCEWHIAQVNSYDIPQATKGIVWICSSLHVNAPLNKNIGPKIVAISRALAVVSFEMKLGEGRKNMVSRWNNRKAKDSYLANLSLPANRARQFRQLFKNEMSKGHLYYYLNSDIIVC